MIQLGLTNQSGRPGRVHPAVRVRVLQATAIELASAGAGSITIILLMLSIFLLHDQIGMRSLEREKIN